MEIVFDSNVREDDVSHLNDALQPFQVPQGEARNSISWSHNAKGPLLLHSRTFVCVCVYVRLHMCSTLTPPPQLYLPSILITPSLAFTGLNGFSHVPPTPGCDLLPCYTTRRIDECSCESLTPSNRHGCTDRHTLQDFIETLSFFLQHCCMFV